MVSRDDPKRYLGRGYESVPGRPFGYAFIMERTAIEDHLIRRSGYKAKTDDLGFSFRVTKIQERIHKYDPTFKERQQAWLARQPRPTGSGLDLTWPELEHLVDLFGSANNPVSRSIAEKAAKALAKRDA